MINSDKLFDLSKNDEVKGVFLDPGDMHTLFIALTAKIFTIHAERLMLDRLFFILYISLHLIIEI